MSYAPFVVKKRLGHFPGVTVGFLASARVTSEHNKMLPINSPLQMKTADYICAGYYYLH
jgi:hypothetical protein